MEGAQAHPDPGTHTPFLPPPPPAQDQELWKSSDKICRQLIYHLTPHSKRKPHRKTQSR